MSEHLKISLDYHGVIDNDITYWREFCLSAHSRGHSIYIISGGPQVLIRAKLAQNRIIYDNLWCILDYCLSLKQIKMLSDGNLIIPDISWNSVKGYLCAQSNIDLHIDDSKIYRSYFQTPFCLYNKKQHYCLLNGFRYDFSIPPQRLLDLIEEALF